MYLCDIRMIGLLTLTLCRGVLRSKSVLITLLLLLGDRVTHIVSGKTK